jgi:hypothetical protein
MSYTISLDAKTTERLRIFSKGGFVLLRLRTLAGRPGKFSRIIEKPIYVVNCRHKSPDIVVSYLDGNKQDVRLRLLREFYPTEEPELAHECLTPEKAKQKGFLAVLLAQQEAIKTSMSYQYSMDIFKKNMEAAITAMQNARA